MMLFLTKFVTMLRISSTQTVKRCHDTNPASYSLSEWERVYLPIDPSVVLLDIAFVPDDPSHGKFNTSKDDNLPRKITTSIFYPKNRAFTPKLFKSHSNWRKRTKKLKLHTDCWRWTHWSRTRRRNCSRLSK